MKLKFFFRKRRISQAKLDTLLSQAKMGAGASQRKGNVELEGSVRSRQRVTPVDDVTVKIGSKDADEMNSDAESEPEEQEDLSVSFGYQCRRQLATSDEEASNPSRNSESSRDEEVSAMTIKLISRKSSSFSCLSGAALSANATLANTALGNGLIGEEILPGLDSPREFIKLVSSASATKLELSRHSETTILSNSDPFISTSFPSPSSRGSKSCSAPNRMESTSFLNATDVQTAGGAAGEDRVQAVCSEENGWLFCGIYDGFNGRDAADYLAGTFYETVGVHLRLLEWHMRREHLSEHHPSAGQRSEAPQRGLIHSRNIPEDEEVLPLGQEGLEDPSMDEVFRQGLMQALERAFSQTECDFLEMVEQEMDERPELVMVGSCVLAVLLHGQDLFTLNVGDSRAVLATTHPPENSISAEKVEGCDLWAVQMTESHVVDNEEENRRVLSEHPDDPGAIAGGRLKGKLKVTRAFGAGYLKHAKMNNALMGILRVKNLFSPPYLGIAPCVLAHRVTHEDNFVVLGSDGLFDFFTNVEVVSLVNNFVHENPTGDPAKYMLEQLLLRAAENAGMSVDQLKGIPIGRRRKYHDDVTIIVISLAAQFPTSTASTIQDED
ncbi:unnamed protein product [Calypogeia fissa]